VDGPIERQKAASRRGCGLLDDVSGNEWCK
jgi:hypothetical protein